MAGGHRVLQPGYDQDAVNTFGAVCALPAVPLSLSDALAGGVDRQQRCRPVRTRTLTFDDKADVTAGLRFDHERSTARTCRRSSRRRFALAERSVAEDDSFSDVSPQFAFGVSRQRRSTRRMFRRRAATRQAVSIPRRLPGSEAYGEEHAWHIEGGLKSARRRQGRVRQCRALLHQLGRSAAECAESVRAGPVLHRQRRQRAAAAASSSTSPRGRSPSVDLFATLGFTNARFGDGTSAGNGVDVTTTIPYTPDYTAIVGGQLSRAINSVDHRLTAAPKSRLTGGFTYDEGNTEGQDAYSLVNFRAGARAQYVFRRSVAAQRVRHAVCADRDSAIPALRRRASSARMGRPRTSALRSAHSYLEATMA